VSSCLLSSGVASASPSKASFESRVEKVVSLMGIRNWPRYPLFDFSRHRKWHNLFEELSKSSRTSEALKKRVKKERACKIEKM
jgi:hypothetical protein